MIRLILKITLYSCHVITFNLIYFFPNLNCVKLASFSGQQSSYVTLKDLRENCKMDLEMINGMASEKH